MIFSFFAGAGFLDLGFEEVGFEIGYVNEFHGPFLQAYKHARQVMGIKSPSYGYFDGSITECLSGSRLNDLSTFVLNAKESGRLVGFIGGPPCPDFSVGGKNRGQYGENGKLSKTYIDLICKQKPDFFVFENVKGLYRTIRHREFFDSLKAQLKKAGYTCTERLINSIEYGAPQDRERIILFGVLNCKNGDIEKFDWLKSTKYDAEDLQKYNWPEAQSIAKTRKKPANVPEQLTLQYWFDKNEVTKHANAGHQFKPRAGLAKFEILDEGDVSKKSYKRLHRWRYSPTAAYGNNEVHIHPYLPRRISVAEALAIQSLPKEFELPPDMTLSNMFKTIGNGVPFLAAKGLAQTILDFLMEIKK
ncbi:DNA cytosine methyltransferase [Polynucleobacter sp. AP-RePozz3-80-G7]|nr:DNA cytosine methyltransferase [Polynucleobacter sp. AP-RePozz3-80-G7]